jgi:hypothetical protein
MLIKMADAIFINIRLCVNPFTSRWVWYESCPQIWGESFQ